MDTVSPLPPKPKSGLDRYNQIFPLPPKPKSALGRYRLLSPQASVRVSPLCLGGMNFGDSWSSYMGECNKKSTFEILDYFHDQGGNFIDTANAYQKGQSEQWIGDWMKERGNRDDIVIATKYATNFRAGIGREGEIMANFTGTGTKSLVTSVTNSLKNLQTDYIDVFYVHWWDYATDIPELMQSLNQLVLAGKILYLGISDTPAWVVSKANEYARNHGLRQFSVYQGQWSAASRDFEREIIPMARAEGMALAPFGALGGGGFKTEEQRKAMAASGEQGRAIPASEKHIAVSKALEVIAKRKNTIITSVALAYVLHKTTYVFPIVGGRKVEHIKGNIEALSLELSPEDIAEIESAVPFDPGFPHNFLSLLGETGPKHPQDAALLPFGGEFDYVPLPEPIKIKKGGD